MAKRKVAAKKAAPKRRVAKKAAPKRKVAAKKAAPKRRVAKKATSKRKTVPMKVVKPSIIPGL